MIPAGTSWNPNGIRQILDPLEIWRPTPTVLNHKCLINVPNKRMGPTIDEVRNHDADGNL